MVDLTNDARQPARRGELAEVRAATAAQVAKTNRLIIILACSTVLMLIAGLTVGIFLLVRTNDARDVQNQVEARVTQTERAFCAFLIQESLNAEAPEDKLIANQALILIQRFGCESKGVLNPPVSK